MAGIENSSNQSARQISSAFDRIQEWVNHVSSGLRINSAKEDPAGLGIRDELRANIADMRQGSNNLSDGISLVQTADASASQIQNNLVRMNELATQASTDTISDKQKQILQNEFDQLSAENDRIAHDTTFNGLAVHQDQSIGVQFGEGQSIDVQVRGIQPVNGDLVHDSVSVSEKLQNAIQELSNYRGELGGATNRMETASDVVDTQTENLVAAESRISNLDMAVAIASKTAQDVVTQSAIAVQVHTDSFSQMILKLLG